MKKLIGALVLILCLTLSGCGDAPQIGDKVDDCDDLPGLVEHCDVDVIHNIRYLNDNWRYFTMSGERDTDLEALFTALYPQYAAIFGEDRMSYKRIIIYDVPDAPYPITKAYDEYTTIKLAVNLSLPDRMAQMIYQLSHEMTHCAINSLRPDESVEDDDWDNNFSKWNKEIICEAMSFYMLDYMSENWDLCSLFQKEPDSAFIDDYFQYCYADGKNLPLKYDTVTYTSEEFKELSDRCDESKEERYNHAAERNYCYQLFQKYGDKVIGEVLRMYDYYNPDYDFIDFTAWEKDSKYPDFVRELSKIQPIIK